MKPPLITFLGLILVVALGVTWGLKGYVGKKVDFRDSQSVAHYGDLFQKACVQGAEQKYVKMRAEPAPDRRANFSKACSCLWDNVVAFGRKRERPVTFTRLEDELADDQGYDDGIGRCAELYPIMPQQQ